MEVDLYRYGECALVGLLLCITRHQSHGVRRESWAERGFFNIGLHQLAPIAALSAATVRVTTRATSTGLHRGDRLVSLLKNAVDEDLSLRVRPVLGDFARNRETDEAFGDHWTQTRMPSEVPEPEQFHQTLEERPRRTQPSSLRSANDVTDPRGT